MMSRAGWSWGSRAPRKGAIVSICGPSATTKEIREDLHRLEANRGEQGQVPPPTGTPRASVTRRWSQRFLRAAASTSSRAREPHGSSMSCLICSPPAPTPAGRRRQPTATELLHEARTLALLQRQGSRHAGADALLVGNGGSRRPKSSPRRSRFAIRSLAVDMKKSATLAEPHVRKQNSETSDSYALAILCNATGSLIAISASIFGFGDHRGVELPISVGS